MKQKIIASLTAEYTPLPLRNPFVISLRSSINANIVRWRLRMTDGSEYLGESVPVQYVTGESPESVLAVAPRFEEYVQGKSLEDFGCILHELEVMHPSDVSARAGLEIALYNAVALTASIPLYKLFGGVTNRVQTDLTLSKVPDAVDIAKLAWTDGFKIFKMKVGGADKNHDFFRVVALQEALPDTIIRLDANQGFEPNEAVEFIGNLVARGIRLEVVEQPVAKEDLSGLDDVARQSPVPILADEACVTPADAFKILSTTRVHGVNVKVMKSGVGGALSIIRIAQAAKRKLMMGCMIESPVGLTTSLAIACGTGAFDYIDLDGHLLIDIRDKIEEFNAEGPFLSIHELTAQ